MNYLQWFFFCPCLVSYIFFSLFINLICPIPLLALCLIIHLYVSILDIFIFSCTVLCSLICMLSQYITSRGPFSTHSNVCCLVSVYLSFFFLISLPLQCSYKFNLPKWDLQCVVLCLSVCVCECVCVWLCVFSCLFFFFR